MFEGFFFVGWVVSLRGLLFGLCGFFVVVDFIFCSVMLVNFVVEWYVLEYSCSEIGELCCEINICKIKVVGVGFFEIVFFLVLSFIFFVNLFMWMRFVSK